jgi:hypothetical protein
MNTQTTEFVVAEQQVEAGAAEVVQLPLSTLEVVGGGQAITSFYHNGPGPRVIAHVL